MPHSVAVVVNVAVSQRYTVQRSAAGIDFTL
jgi:hypothetical protein